MSRGRRVDDAPRLNRKKVAATIIAIVVLIMIIISLKKILSKENLEKKFIQSEAYFSALENGTWGIINSAGEKVDDFSSEEMVLVPDNTKDVFIYFYDIDYEKETYKTKVLDSKQNELFTNYTNVEPLQNSNASEAWYEVNVLRFTEGSKYGLIDYKGKEVVKPEYDNIYPLSGIKNCLIIEKDGEKGLFNAYTEEIIIEPNYSDIKCLSNDYKSGYLVINHDGKVGLIGSDKSRILTCQYDEIKSVFGNDYYVVIENGKLEIINANGKIVLNKGFDTVEAIGLDNFIITSNGKYGLIDKEGKSIIGTEYEDLKYSITDYFIAKKDSKYGIINKENETIVDFTYNAINYINEADFYKAENDDYTTNIIDRNFNTVISNVILSEINLEDGYLRVRQNEDYKYYNFQFEEKSNKEVLTRNTLFLVKENGKYGYDNKSGQRIVDCIYDDAKEQNAYGYCAVNQNGLWGALKSDGTIVVEPYTDLADNIYTDFIGTWHRYNDSSLNVYTK